LIADTPIQTEPIPILPKKSIKIPLPIQEVLHLFIQSIIKQVVAPSILGFKDKIGQDKAEQLISTFQGAEDAFPGFTRLIIQEIAQQLK
jgi:hypothetical protein